MSLSQRESKFVRFLVLLFIQSFLPYRLLFQSNKEKKKQKKKNCKYTLYKA